MDAALLARSRHRARREYAETQGPIRELGEPRRGRGRDVRGRPGHAGALRTAHAQRQVLPRVARRRHTSRRPGRAEALVQRALLPERQGPHPASRPERESGARRRRCDRPARAASRSTPDGYAPTRLAVDAAANERAALRAQGGTSSSRRVVEGRGHSSRLGNRLGRRRKIGARQSVSARHGTDRSPNTPRRFCSEPSNRRSDLVRDAMPPTSSWKSMFEPRSLASTASSQASALRTRCESEISMRLCLPDWSVKVSTSPEENDTEPAYVSLVPSVSHRRWIDLQPILQAGARPGSACPHCGL